MAQDIAKLNPGPEWLAHRYDATQDSVHFHVVDRPARRNIPFLTDQYLGLHHEPLIIPRRRLALERAPIHFIFHSAYCCSTLLANGLDVEGSATVLKEPVLLNDLVGWRHEGAAPNAVSDMLGTAMSLMARPFQAGEATIVKPSNVVNGLATAIMTLRPDARAIILYAPLEAYLTSIARKGMTGRLWARELFSRQMIDGLVDFGFSPRDHIMHTDIQIAAIGWLAQFRLFAMMAHRWPDRIRTISSDVLTENPKDSLETALAFFGAKPPTGGVKAIVDQIFGVNAKDGSAFSAEQRKQDHRQGRNLYGDEVGKVVQWSDLLAKSAGLSDVLPVPLLK